MSKNVPDGYEAPNPMRDNIVGLSPDNEIGMIAAVPECRTVIAELKGRINLLHPEDCRPP
jgi:hypothetical protein